MRAIKFRAQDIASNKWLYGDVRHHKDDVCIFEQGGTKGEQVKRETVGQFTGLTDKTGKEIYEGDIVECVSWNEFFSDGSGKPMEPFRRRMVVKFHNGAFKMIEEFPEPMKPSYWDLIYDGDIVVIGNIYNNPELLKKGSENK